MDDSVRSCLVGAWQLVEYSMTASTGEVHYPLGPDATGLIMYTADGYMSAQLMAPDRQRFAAPGVHSGTEDELSSAASGYLAYSGRYQIEDDCRTVHHVVSASLFPNWIGTDRIRYIDVLDNENLTLTSVSQQMRGMSWDPAVVWRRARAS